MGIVPGVIGSMLGELTSLVSGLYSSLVGYLAAIATALVGFLWGKLAALLAVLSTVLWGFLVVFGLFAAAVVLRVLGVDDVYGTLHRRIDDYNDEATEETDDGIPAIPDISADSVTDDAGRFSQSAFVTATGMTPAEFIHLFVKSNGGRVRQSTLNTCLPWSKSTVSRHLDLLEEDGVVRRITIGRQNIVCTPDAVPEIAETSAPPDPCQG